jgi:hypothetical protein
MLKTAGLQQTAGSHQAILIAFSGREAGRPSLLATADEVIE